MGIRRQIQSIGKAAAAALVLTGCDGRIVEPAASPGEGPGAPAGGGPGAGDVSGPGAATAPLECSAVVAGSAPLRRLTRAEYDNAASALLGQSVSVAREFVADERVGPFESNLTGAVPELAVDQYRVAAEQLAADAAVDPDALVPCDPGVDGEQACGKQFIRDFGRRAYRRPLSEEERARYEMLLQSQLDAGGFADGVRLIVQAMLQSPHFLYHTVETDPPSDAGVARMTAHSIASRLSFFLWRSIPDPELLDAADRGALDTAEGIERQVRRMLASERARPVLVDFHLQWLGLRQLPDVAVDDLDAELREGMRAEMQAFVDHVLRHEDASMHELLTASYAFPDATTAPLYDLELSERTRVELDPERRRGLLMQPGVLTVHHSPVTRGKLIREQLLCQSIPAPPAEVDTDLPPPEPGISPRERWEQHVADPACSGCHGLLDPIGFGFDHFDELGRWREEHDGGFAVEADGELTNTQDADGPFDGAPELMGRLAESEEVRQCVARQWVRFALGRALDRPDECLLERAYERFEASGFDVRELVAAIATSPEFVHVEVEL